MKVIPGAFGAGNQMNIFGTDGKSQLEKRNKRERRVNRTLNLVEYLQLHCAAKMQVNQIVKRT
jgi:hypothetical protein